MNRDYITQKELRIINKKYRTEAQKDRHLWPYNSYKAVEYAIRLAREFRRCSSEVSKIEYDNLLDSLVSKYINDERKQ